MCALYRIIPGECLKNRVICFYFNAFKKNDFKISYEKNYFRVFLPDFELKIHENPYSDLILLGEYLKNYEPQKNDIVIDAGASIGIFSMFVSMKMNNTGRIIAFEPDEENFEKLVRNIKLNKIKNVIPLKKGLWSEDAVLNFDKRGDGTSSFISDEKGCSPKVPVVSLDKELGRMGLKKVNFIKMDIEGAEIEAVKGSEKTLKNNDLRLTIASYHVVNGEKTCKKLEKNLSSYGFKAKTSFPDHLTTHASKSGLR